MIIGIGCNTNDYKLGIVVTVTVGICSSHCILARVDNPLSTLDISNK